MIGLTEHRFERANGYHARESEAEAVAGVYGESDPDVAVDHEWVPTGGAK